MTQPSRRRGGLGRGLASLIPTGPGDGGPRLGDAAADVVIGGGVGNLDLLYEEKTRAAITAFLFNDLFDTPLLKPSLGDSAGVFGAAMLVR
jgi:hypothetical protein